MSFDVYRDVLVTWGGAVFSGFSEVAKPYVEAYNAELERTGKSVLTQTEKVSLFVAEQQRTMRLLESNARAYAAAAAEAGEKGIAAIMTKWSNYFSAKAAQVPIGIAERQAWLADLVADANSRIAHVDQVIGRFGFKPGKLAGPIIDGAQMISGAHKYYETGDSTEWENACAGVSLSWLLAAEAPIVVTAIAGTTLAAPYLLAAAAVGAAVGSFVGGKYFQDFKEALLSSDWFIAGVDAIAEATTTHFRAAFTLPKCDPLAIDLDGDGIETVGIGGSPVLFDHDGDGLRSGTGWLAGDD
ncbi:MAG: hypothetical protein HUU30_14020, partial [Burkholderiaceae bacterium]|nr:hypothetical protein [Burkholderiaceae bacterium]